MASHNTACRTEPFPLSRRLIVDGCELGRKKHIIHSLTEMDVTLARQRIRKWRAQTGVGLSLTGYFIGCVAATVAENPLCHAYRKGRKLIMYHDVDIGTLVEGEVEGKKLATYAVIRAADKKSLDEIHAAIREAQAAPAASHRQERMWKLFLALPGFLRRLYWWWFERHPETRKRLIGTVSVSAIGMFGRGAGWGIPMPSATLSITIGGIAKKPGIVDGRIEPREFVAVTVSVDHDIVDGAPLARFVSRLKEKVERAILFPERPVRAEQNLV